MYLGTQRRSWPYIDNIRCDIDRDGKEEACTLTYGPTSGVFSFYLNVNGNSVLYVLSGHYYLSFEVTQNGRLRIRGERNGDSTDVVYFDIYEIDGQYFLESKEEGIFLRDIGPVTPSK